MLTAAPFVFPRAATAAAPAQAAQSKSQPSKSSPSAPTDTAPPGKTSTSKSGGTAAPSKSVSPAKSTPSKSTASPQKKRTKSRRTRARGEQKPTTDRIKEIQQALSREGHYQGQPTGKWDSATTDAVKSFQQANALTPTGKLDARTLQKLGLGSQVAGQAPPHPTAAAGPPSADPRR